MGTGIHGGFGHTNGLQNQIKKVKPQKTESTKKERMFSSTGHVTETSIRNHAEFFLGKSVAKSEHEVNKRGYETIRRPSKHSTSKAKIIVTTNTSEKRNISQLQVSPGSKRHGNVPYVKISTTDSGKYKIINASKSEYKTDGKENAKLIFRRTKNENHYTILWI